MVGSETFNNRVFDNNKFRKRFDNIEDCVNHHFHDCTFNNVKFSYINIKHGDFKGCTFNNCNFDCSDFEGTDMSYCKFNKVDMIGTLMWWVNLTGAKFIDTNIKQAVFSNATMTGVKFYGKVFTDDDTLGFFPCCPSEGAFIGWWKYGKYLVKYRIPESAERGGYTNRVCYASKARVIDIMLVEDTDKHFDSVVVDGVDKLSVGQMLKGDGKKDIFYRGGIRFFVSKEECMMLWHLFGGDYCNALQSKEDEGFFTDDVIGKLKQAGMKDDVIRNISRLFDNINVGESKCFGGWYGDYIPLSKKQANIINSYGVFEITFHYEKVLDMCGYVDNDYICVKHIK